MIPLALACAAAAAYQAVALLACILHWRRSDPAPSSFPPFSILKPVHRPDEGFAPALQSHASIDYPDFEVLLGVGAGEDIPALPRVRTVTVESSAPNPKAGKLEVLAQQARHSLIAVNDADISVPPEYLRTLAGCLEDPGVGLVTCLYRADGRGYAAKWEALGIATDFAPSALVAPLVGVKEFGLGSTLAFRASEFERAGGFAAVREYIADDYQVGRHMTAAGLRVHLSRMPVSTWLGRCTWQSAWRHQVRWARTIRLSRGAYFALPVTNASLWALLAGVYGWWWASAGLLALRLTVGLVCGLLILRDPVTARWWWLMPFRDLWGLGVWAAGAVGDTVEWSGRTMRLDRSGRIVQLSL